jgi:L-Ala-D/L-Glu epimerase
MRAWLTHVVVPRFTPFAHARATRAASDSVVLLLDVEGVQGVGEAAPRPYVTGETTATVLESLRRLDLDVTRPILDAPDFESAIRRLEAADLAQLLSGQAAGCALELALLDLLGKRFGRPARSVGAVLGIRDELRQQEGTRHPPNSRALDASTTPAQFVERLRGRKPPHLKVKVGLGKQKDVERVAEVRKLLGDAVQLSVDANMEWSLEQAVETLLALKPYGLAWCEEPLAKGQLEACRVLRDRTGVPVMLDESLCTRTDAEAAIAARACELFNIRVSKCGGLLPSIRLVEIADRVGLRFQVGVQVAELGILIAAGRHLIGAVRGALAFEGADPTRTLESSVVNESLAPGDDGFFTDLAGNGLGVTLDVGAARKYSQLQFVYDGKWVKDKEWNA